jgi:hypothetical protein
MSAHVHEHDIQHVHVHVGTLGSSPAYAVFRKPTGGRICRLVLFACRVLKVKSSQVGRRWRPSGPAFLTCNHVQTPNLARFHNIGSASAISFWFARGRARGGRLAAPARRLVKGTAERARAAIFSVCQILAKQGRTPQAVRADTRRAARGAASCRLTCLSLCLS